MIIQLKRKYTDRNEPNSWRNVAGKKNTPQFGGGGSGNAKAKGKHIMRPVMPSGRRCQPRQYGMAKR